MMLNISGRSIAAAFFFVCMAGFSAADSDFRGVRVSELARSGNPVPDYAAGSEFINFRDAPILGDNFGDRVLFRGMVSTPSGNRDSLWYFLHGDSRIVRGIVAGDEVHRAPAGATLSTSDF